MIKKLKIPKAPSSEKKSYKRKIRRSWKINPVEKVHPNEKKLKKNRRYTKKDWQGEID